jgi:hypothetical protein
MDNPPLTKVQELADFTHSSNKNLPAGNEYWVASTFNQILRVLFGKVVLGKTWEFR